MSDHGGQPVGSLAEELAKLMGVVSGLADQTAHGGGEHGDGESEGGGRESGDRETDSNHKTDPASAPAPPCQVCPVCQTIAFVRSTSPEVREHLTSSAASLAAAARGLLDAVAAQHGEPQRRDSTVENIDLSEDGPWD